jgi:hypothetical protein
MVAAGSDKILEFLQHLKESNNDTITQNQGKYTISTSLLYKEYCNFLVDNCDMEKVSLTAFGLSLKNYKQISKIRQESGIFTVINYN